MSQKLLSEDAAMGMLFGLALGDSWTTNGIWDAHTTHALCLAQMLRSANGWDGEDAMRRLINWRDHGYLNASRNARGMDGATAQALRTFESSQNPYSGPDDPTASTHALSRLGPVVIAYGAQIRSAQAVAQLQSRLTHGARDHVQAAARLAETLLRGAIHDLPKPESPPQSETSLRDVLNATFWALTQSADPETRIGSAATVGRSSAALTGLIAGRVSGYDGLPQDRIASLHDRAKLTTIARDLYALRPIDM